MKFLFVHQNYPGQFLHLVRHLVGMQRHEILFITEPNANEIPGVRKIPYVRPPLGNKETHIAARELDDGVRRAEVVFKAAHGLRHLGFKPDIIIGHHGWGEMLNLGDVWPDVPMLGYMEFYYQFNAADVGFDPEFPHDPLDYPRIRAKNAINHLALNLGGAGQTPTQWQLSTYPGWAQQRIEVIWEGVNLQACSPDARIRRQTLTIGGMTIRPNDKLVTYVSRDLEPYRGFHAMMRTLPRLMRARKDLKVVMVGGDGVSYGSPPQGGGTWREMMLREVGSDIDLDRLAFPGRVPYESYIALLRRSDAHVYLTYPFVASWSLREALAVGCPVIGSDTDPVREFITHGDNGLLVPFHDPKGSATTILDLLDNKSLSRKLRTNARLYAEKRLDMDAYLTAYTAVIERLTGRNPADEARPEALSPHSPPIVPRRRKAA